MTDTPHNNDDASTDTTASESDPFYVGDLPLPRAIKRFIVPWVIGNLVLAICIGVVIAQQHRDPGDGTWDTGQAVTIEGVLTMNPYPLLRSEGRTYILVEQGKFGVQQRIEDDQIAAGNVSVTGYLIERDGRTVLELDDTQPNPIANVISARLDHSFLEDYEDHGTHTLVGEIVDPKCYLGVMQPGDGKTHKTCATLCIAGGIPPVFLVRDELGNTAAYLLTDSAGGALPEAYYPYIADPVRLTGQVIRQGDLLILRADLERIQRLAADE